MISCQNEVPVVDYEPDTELCCTCQPKPQTTTKAPTTTSTPFTSPLPITRTRPTTPGYSAYSGRWLRFVFVADFVTLEIF